LGISCGDLQVQQAKQQLFTKLAQAMSEGKLQVRELPAPERQQSASAPAAAPAKVAPAKANKPGGAAQAGTGEKTGPASNNETGTNASGTVTPDKTQVECVGDPVSTCTGEEILELIDFELPGPLPL